VKSKGRGCFALSQKQLEAGELAHGQTLHQPFLPSNFRGRAKGKRPQFFQRPRAIGSDDDVSSIELATEVSVVFTTVWTTVERLFGCQKAPSAAPDIEGLSSQ